MAAGIEVVTTPTGKWLGKALRGCRRLTISSPFVTCELGDLLGGAPRSVKCRLLTRTRIADFALGASDLYALGELRDRGVSIRSHSLLHAKVYVIDSSVALVTSANATRYGMNVNLECGVAITDAKTARRIEKDVWSGFGAEDPPTNVTPSFIKKLKDILPTVKVPVARVRRAAADAAEPQEVLEIPELDSFLDALSGWSRLTVESVLRLGKARFTLRELYAIAVPAGRERYPNNKHVEAKIRQQMQRLRDMGVVWFEKPGTYSILFRCGE